MTDDYARKPWDEWVVAGFEANTLNCLRCGQKHVLDVPMPIGDFQKAMRAFISLHKICKPKAVAA